jgi:hypothetical protein
MSTGLPGFAGKVVRQLFLHSDGLFEASLVVNPVIFPGADAALFTGKKKKNIYIYNFNFRTLKNICCTPY